MLKAVGYLRVSGTAQVEGDGFPRQREAIGKYAAANGYEIVKWWEDKGVSGAVEGVDRPVWYMGLLEAKEAGHVIIIETLDRLARDLVLQEFIIRDLSQAKVSLLSVAEPNLGSDEPARATTRQIFGSVAQYDKAMLVSKLKVARQRKKEQEGRCEGQKPYGSLPGEQETHAKILQMARAGFGYSAIARALNQMGIPPRSNSPRGWFPTTVSGILSLARGEKGGERTVVPRKRRKVVAEA
jgi:DNA invertase Pin-like site-specific DNA recombinase